MPMPMASRWGQPPCQAVGYAVQYGALYAEELVNRKLVKKIGCAYVPDPMHLAVDRPLYGVRMRGPIFACL